MRVRMHMFLYQYVASSYYAPKSASFTLALWAQSTTQGVYTRRPQQVAGKKTDEMGSAHAWPIQQPLPTRKEREGGRGGGGEGFNGGGFCPDASAD